MDKVSIAQRTRPERGRIPGSLFAEVKERVSLVGYASTLTKMDSFGRDWWIGRCPLPDHEDKTPSFYVYPDGRAHCYGCAFHGDVFDLYAAVEGLDSPKKAVMELALEYGVQLRGRSEKWHEWHGRKRQVLDMAAEIRKRSWRRRAFKLILLPEFEGIEDEQERHEEIAVAWRSFQQDTRRMGR